MDKSKSLVYSALCELSDAEDNLIELRKVVDSDLLLSYLDDVISDIDSAYDKLKNISL